MSYRPEIIPSALFSLRANLLFNYGLENGVKVEDLLAGTGIMQGGLLQGGTHVSVHQYLRMLSNFLGARGPVSGIEYGKRINITARGTVGLAALSMGTMGEVARFAIKYQEVMEIPQRASLEYIGDEVHIHFHFDDELKSQPDLLRFLIESHFASYVCTSRYLLHAHFEPTAVYLPYPVPRNTDEYQALFGRKVMFDHSACKFVIPRELMEAALPTANPMVARACYSACDDLLRQFRKSQTLAYRINGILLERGEGYPSLKELAGLLSLDERTIRRRLSSEKTSYKALLNQARARHAARLLAVRSNSVESVAMELGFNNASNFRRAFKVWTGLNPGEYRENSDTNRLAMAS